MKPILLVHGFGLRGFFWDKLSEGLPADRFVVRAPDFTYKGPDDAVTQIAASASSLGKEYGQKPAVIGHSLGGIMSALAVKHHPEEFSHGVILSSPFGKKPTNPIERFVRFLLRHRLLPGGLVRKRFFGQRIPVEAQKELFDRAIPEPQELLEVIGSPHWFHNDEFAAALPTPMLGIGSEADQIVPVDQTEEFLRTIGGRFVRLPRSLAIGHDDIAVDGNTARAYLKEILDFLDDPIQS